MGDEPLVDLHGGHAVKDGLADGPLLHVELAEFDEELRRVERLLARVLRAVRRRQHVALLDQRAAAPKLAAGAAAALHRRKTHANNKQKSVSSSTRWPSPSVRQSYLHFHLHGAALSAAPLLDPTLATQLISTLRH